MYTMGSLSASAGSSARPGSCCSPSSVDRLLAALPVTAANCRRPLNRRDIALKRGEIEAFSVASTTWGCELALALKAARAFELAMLVICALGRAAVAASEMPLAVLGPAL